MNDAEDIKRYMKTSHEAFWQNVFQVEIDYLISRLQGSRNILSVGCGPAFIEGELSRHGFQVTGLDISAEALKCAPNIVRTVAGRAEDMPFPNASFDAAIFIASLQFIEDYRKALQRTHAVLRLHGKIVIMLLNPESEFFKTMRLEPDAYVNLIQHTDLHEIENAVGRYFALQTEYILGISNQNIFKSKEPDQAALYVITGQKIDHESQS